MKSMLSILAMLILASCGGGKGHQPKGEMTACVVDSIAERQRSAIEFDRTCMVYLDCGACFSERCGRSKIGDTIYIYKSEIK